MEISSGNTPHGSLSATAPEVIDSSGGATYGSNIFSHAQGISLNATPVNSIGRDMTVHGAAGNMYTRVIVNTSPAAAADATRSESHPTAFRSDLTNDIYEQESETYARLLWSKGRGYPLWWPEPESSLPAEYRDTGVSIGDVGIVTAEGDFDYLFNICHPRDHPVNANGVPSNFEPIVLPTTLETRSKRENGYCSVTSKAIEYLHETQLMPYNSHVFQCSTSEGAILMLPEGSTQEDLKHLADFQRYAIQNGQSWYHYARACHPEGRGRLFSNGSICLVTGYTKGTSWLVASFSRVPHNSFQVKFTGNVSQNETGYSYHWNCSGPVVVNYGPSPVPASLENQCMFLRGFTITVNHGIWARISSPAEVSQIVHESFSKFSSKTLASSHQQSMFSSVLSHIGIGGTSKSNPSDCSSAPAVDASLNFASKTTIMSPAQVINQFLLDQCAEAEIAISHDSDWSHLMNEEDVILYDAEFLNNPKFTCDIQYEAGAVCLIKKEADLPSGNDTKFKDPPQARTLHVANEQPSDVHGKVLSADTGATSTADEDILNEGKEELWLASSPEIGQLHQELYPQYDELTGSPPGSVSVPSSRDTTTHDTEDTTEKLKDSVTDVPVAAARLKESIAAQFKDSFTHWQKSRQQDESKNTTDVDEQISRYGETKSAEEENAAGNNAQPRPFTHALWQQRNQAHENDQALAIQAIINLQKEQDMLTKLPTEEIHLESELEKTESDKEDIEETEKREKMSGKMEKREKGQQHHAERQNEYDLAISLPPLMMSPELKLSKSIPADPVTSDLQGDMVTGPATELRKDIDTHPPAVFLQGLTPEDGNPVGRGIQMSTPADFARTFYRSRSPRRGIASRTSRRNTHINRIHFSPPPIPYAATVPRSHRFNPIAAPATRASTRATHRLRSSRSNDESGGEVEDTEDEVKDSEDKIEDSEDEVEDSEDEVDDSEDEVDVSEDGVDDSEDTIDDVQLASTSRHKTIRRQLIKSEQRRRDELRDAYDRINDSLPSSKQKFSKISLLDRATAHIRYLEVVKEQLEMRLRSSEAEVQRLRNVNEALMLGAADNSHSSPMLVDFPYNFPAPAMPSTPHMTSPSPMLVDHPHNQLPSAMPSPPHVTSRHMFQTMSQIPREEQLFEEQDRRAELAGFRRTASEGGSVNNAMDGLSLPRLTTMRSVIHPPPATSSTLHIMNRHIPPTEMSEDPTWGTLREHQVSRADHIGLLRTVSGGRSANNAIGGLRSLTTIPTKKAGIHKVKGATSAKSGCYTCRIRRKKCDGQPNESGHCQTCVRLRLQCLGFGAKRPEWLRENRNVVELREKIKNFLSAQGMIKGHSGSGPRSAEHELVLADGESCKQSSSSEIPPALLMLHVPHDSHPNHHISDVMGQTWMPATEASNQMKMQAGGGVMQSGTEGAAEARYGEAREGRRGEESQFNGDCYLQGW